MAPVMSAIPLALVLLTGQLRVLVSQQPFVPSGPRQFTIRTSNNLSSRERYFLAYLDDRLATELRSAAERAAALTQRVELQSQAFQYTQQAAILTRQFALAERASWIDIQQALGGPDEFITPLINDMEKNVLTLESRGAADQASRLRDSIWSERAFLLRIEPARRRDLETRFARERPDESFDLFLADRLVNGRPILPEGALISPEADGAGVEMRSFRSEWRVLVVWDTTCRDCRETLAIADALAREFPGRVFAIAAHDAPEQVRLYLAEASLTVPAAVAPDAVVRQLGASILPAHIVVSPDGRFAPLSGDAWGEQARRILAAAQR